MNHQSEYIISPSGNTLFNRFWKGHKTKPVVLIGHSQPTHSGHFLDIANAFAEKGWTVHAGDLSAHGNSTFNNTKLVHFEDESGWDTLIKDMNALAQHAFKDVPFERRVMAVQNISGLLTMEVLKSTPDLAKHIVLSLPANQKVIAMLSRAFVKARMKIKPPDEPDEHTLYNVYSFLSSRLDNARHGGDVMSANHEIVDAIMSDPLGFPTPTLGYWSAIFKGNDTAWNWPGDKTINPQTRFMLLNGDSDSVGQGGQSKQTRQWLENAGSKNVTHHRILGGRTAILLDEKEFDISSIISDWVDYESDVSSPEINEEKLQSISMMVLEKIGAQPFSPNQPLRIEDLIALCYEAIDDEDKWVELLYRLSANLSQNEVTNSHEVENLLFSIMPHWDKSYQINKRIMSNSALGIILQNVIDRLDIGTAIISNKRKVLYHNKTFEDELQHMQPDTRSEIDISTRLQDILGKDFFSRIERDEREIIISYKGHPVGFFFEPEAMKNSDNGEGAVGLIVLRTGRQKGEAKTRAQLSMLELAYGLTPQEACVALEIANGLSPAKISEKMEVSINTIRTHLKKGYEKMGVEGQTEMAARIMRGPIGWLSK